MMLPLASIRLRLWLATALPAMLVIALLAIGVAAQYGDFMTRALKDRGIASARQLGSAAEFMLFAGDREGLMRLTAAAMRSDRQLHGIMVYNVQGQLRASAGQVTDPLPRLDAALQTQLRQHLLVVQAIYATSVQIDDPYAMGPSASTGQGTDAHGRLLGHVVLEMSLQALAQQQHELMLWTLLTAAGGLLLAGVLASLIGAMVTTQIARISRVVEDVSKGHLDTRVDVTASGILHPLATGINAMVAKVAITQEELQQQIAHATQELRAQKDAAEQTARTDVLTGVASRRAFSDVAEAEMQRALRYGTELSLLMMDLDHFKAVNDNHGHAAGDAVLVRFAQIVLQHVRTVDLVARLGGEEFAVLLPNVSALQAMALAERIREAFANTPLHLNGQSLCFTVSMGVAQFDPSDVALTGWLARADAALYRAKAQGRNRVVQA